MSSSTSGWYRVSLPSASGDPWPGKASTEPDPEDGAENMASIWWTNEWNRRCHSVAPPWGTKRVCVWDDAGVRRRLGVDRLDMTGQDRNKVKKKTHYLIRQGVAHPCSLHQMVQPEVSTRCDGTTTIGGAIYLTFPQLKWHCRTWWSERLVVVNTIWSHNLSKSSTAFFFHLYLSYPTSIIISNWTG